MRDSEPAARWARVLSCIACPFSRDRPDMIEYSKKLRPESRLSCRSMACGSATSREVRLTQASSSSFDSQGVSLVT